MPVLAYLKQASWLPKRRLRSRATMFFRQRGCLAEEKWIQDAVVHEMEARRAFALGEAGNEAMGMERGIGVIRMAYMAACRIGAERKASSGL